MQSPDVETPLTDSAELDYGLQSRFLAQLNPDQKLRVFDLTTRASRELHRWAARYPLIRRVRVWPLSLSVAAAAPFATADALVTMARMSLWVFTIDDLFDEETVPFAELTKRVTRYREILAGSKLMEPRERNTLAIALHDIRQDLSRYELFPALHDEWAAAVTGTLDAMMREHHWRLLYRTSGDVPQLPSYQMYLDDGLFSIGGPPHIWTTLIAIGDQSILQHMNLLQDMEREVSLCIRLANDLQSYKKEIAEGKINSIVIRQQEALAIGYSPEAALDRACETVRQEMLAGLERCAQLQSRAQTVTGQPEQAIADIARFVCDFYVHHDYHTFTASPTRS